MTATELRIGNIITRQESSREWNVIAIKQYDYIEVYGERTFDGGDISEFEGIPLTEEWLLKFGFEYKGAFTNKVYLNGSPSGDMDGSILYENESQSATVYVKDNKFYYQIAINTNDYDDSIDTVELKYVHHFQNLHYALKLQELKIK